MVTEDGQPYRKAWSVEIIPAGEIRPGDQLLAANSLGGMTGTKSPTREVCTPAFMEALGMIIGDGFFARPGGYKAIVGISHSEGAEYLAHYIAAIETEFAAGDGPYAMRNGGRVALKAKRRDRNTTVFYSSPMYAELEACGIAGTAKTKRVPSWVFALGDDLKLAFLRGYLDADGTVNRNGHIRYVSVNQELLEGVRHLCVGVGIRCGNLFATEINSMFDGVAYHHTLWGFICTDARDNQRIGSHTSMYQRRLSQRLSPRSVRQCRVYPNEAKRRAQQIGVLFTTVLSVRPEANHQPVYNLTVEGGHNFIADGVLVRNSNIEHLAIEFYTETLMPWCVRIEKAINRQLLQTAEKGKLFAKHNIAGLLRGDFASRMAGYSIALQNGKNSINEVRDLEDENPIEGGDAHHIQLNMQTVPGTGAETTSQAAQLVKISDGGRRAPANGR